MILVTPFKSAVKVVTESSLAAPVDFFKNSSIITQVKCPIFIIHGTEDSVVPFSHGQKLYQILKDNRHPKLHSPLWIEGGDHNDLTSFPQYIRGLQEFITLVTSSNNWD